MVVVVVFYLCIPSRDGQVGEKTSCCQLSFACHKMIDTESTSVRTRPSMPQAQCLTVRKAHETGDSIEQDNGFHVSDDSQRCWTLSHPGMFFFSTQHGQVLYQGGLHYDALQPLATWSYDLARDELEQPGPSRQMMCGYDIKKPVMIISYYPISGMITPLISIYDHAQPFITGKGP